MTGATMVKQGMIVDVGYNYLTDDGRILYRVYKGSSTVWQVGDSPVLYRSLFEAYNEDDSFASSWNNKCYRVEEVN